MKRKKSSKTICRLIRKFGHIIMRVIEVLFTYPPQVFIARHFAAIRDNGVDPVFAALEDTSGGAGNAASILEESIDFGRVCIPAPPNNWFQKMTGLRYLLRPHTRIRSSIRDQIIGACFESLKPDLIHFHWGNLAGYLHHIPETLGIPYTLSLRGSDIQVFPFQSEEKRQMVKRAIEGAAGVHTVCDNLWYEAETELDFKPQSIFHKTIYTPVPPSSAPAPRKPGSKKTFVSIARFHWRKSLVILLIAFAKYINRYPNSELILVGEGELKDAIQYWIRFLHLEKAVSLVGKKTYPEIREIIQNASGFIQSSIAEGVSNATAEAMMLGCPVFATSIGGTGEIITDGVNGFLLDPASPEEWWKKLEMTQDETLMSSIKQKAYETALSVFSPSRHAVDFTDFFSQALLANQSHR